MAVSSNLCARTTLDVTAHLPCSYFVQAVVPPTPGNPAREYYDKVGSLTKGIEIARRWHYLWAPLGIEVTVMKRVGRGVFTVWDASRE